VPEKCFICLTIKASDEGRNPGFVAKLRTGYVVLNVQGQYHRGYTIFQCRQCVPELHDLPPRLRSEFLNEMSLVAESVFRAFRPVKLNYELLGNTVPHLHWHLVPRHAGDPKPKVPAWENEEFIASLRAPPSMGEVELIRLKEALLGELVFVAGSRVRSSFVET
jgi:diadenosine tetraphosphate (Ap4A) HIT family hydrolase